MIPVSHRPVQRHHFAKRLPASILDGLAGATYCTRVAQDTDEVALPKPWFGNRGKDFHTFRVRFVGECVAFFVGETPRKPTVEQVDAFADIMVRTFVTSTTEQTLQDGGPYRRCC